MALPLRLHAGLWGLDRIDSRSPQRNYAYDYTGDGTGVHIYVVDTVKYLLSAACCNLLAPDEFASAPIMCFTAC